MDGTGPHVIEVSGLEKTFADFWGRPKVEALKGISFTVQSGEVFGLLGPNGSGKSTTIKLLLGLLRPTGGLLRALGCRPARVAAKQDIGYLPEETYLYGFLTPRETLHFFGKLFNLEKRARTERVEELIDMVGLRDAADRPVTEFSKGMARRLGLAQALVNNPKLVILDEPTSGLDPIGCRQVKDIIIRLAEQGRTVLLSSHLLADVEDVCSRIAILYNGEIRAEGRVDTLLTRQDCTRLTLPDMTPEALDRVVAEVARLSGAAPDVERPARTLEEFFLDVVAAVRREARQGGDRAVPQDRPPLAPFLDESPASAGKAS